jgi:hypothetical protein
VLSWEDNLPPLPKELRKLAEKHDRAATTVAAGR